MRKGYYSDYAEYCLKFYIRHPNATFSNEANERNWKTAESIFKELDDSEKEILTYVYSERDTLADNVYNFSKVHNMEQEVIWKIIADTKYKIAERRGLI